MGCIESELLLATGATGAALLGHLEECDSCMRLARELENPVVADAIDEACEAASDLPELTIVPSENYRRGKGIGRGGMGRIVRARDRRLGRAVAIKELLDERLRARFEREARLTARLQHPAIVSVHEVGRWPSGSPFYAMKFVAGRPLNEVIADRPALAERLALLPNIVTVVEAIAYAHSERVIHRDLKPHNILIGPFGETVVIDWGLAKELGAAEAPEAASPFRDDGEGLTRAGAGTPEYMPPEQARGEAPDERVDVYALGATLHHLLAGAAPKRRAPLPPATPPELATIIAKAMAEKPGDRYPSARELAAELVRFQSGQLVGAHRYSLGQLAGRWLRRHRTVFALASAFVLALSGTGAVSVARIVAARREAVAQRDSANRAYAELLVERGRQELQLGAPARALAYLQAALAQGLDSKAIRFLVAEARRSTAPLLLSTDDEGRGVAMAALGRDGTILALASHKGGVRLVNVATGRTRTELPGRIRPRGMLFDATGERLATWGDGLEAQIWEVATGHLLATPTGEEKIEGARFHRDGRLVTWAGNHASVWSPAGTLIATASGHTERVLGATLNPSGRYLATASRDGSARLWDAATGAPVRTVVNKTSGLADVAFDRDGRRLATAGWDLKARVFDVATGKQLAELPADESLLSVVFSSDGGTLIAHGSYGARIWKLDTGAIVATVHHGGYHATAGVLPDGDGLFVAGVDGNARLYEIDGRQAEIFEGHDQALTAVSASGDGRRIVTLGGGAAKVWQVGSYRAPLPMPGRVGAYEFDMAGRLATASSKWLQLWDTKTGRLLASRYANDLATLDVIPTSEGLHVYESAGRHGLWNPATGEIERPAGLPQLIRPLTYAPAAGLMLAADLSLEAQETRQAKMYPVRSESIVLADASGRRLRKLPGGNYNDVFALSPGGEWMGIAGSGRLQVWDTAKDASLVRQLSDLPAIRAFALHAPSGTAIIVNEHNQATIWDVPSGRIRRVIRGRATGVGAVSISADGIFALSGADDGTVTMWEVASGQPLATWTFPTAVNHVVFSPDGSRTLIFTSEASWLLDVSIDDRPASALAAEMAERVPYRFEQRSLLASTPPANLVTAQASRPAPLPAPLPAIDCPPGTRPRGGQPPEDLVAWCQLPSGALDGPARRWWPAGGKLAEMSYDRGTLAGRLTTWDPAGHLSGTLEIDGDSETEARFHPDGSKASELHRFETEPVGEYRAWYPDGSLREIGRYGKPGTRHSLAKSMPHGFWTTYHRDGSKESEGLYVVRLGGRLSWFLGESLKVGVWTYWDEKGHARLEQHGCGLGSDEVIADMPVLPQCR